MATQQDFVDIQYFYVKLQIQLHVMVYVGIYIYRVSLLAW